MSLITTQPSPGRNLLVTDAYADESWILPQLLRGDDFPGFILDFIQSRHIDVIHVMNSRLGFNLLPELIGLPRRPAVVVQLHVEESDRSGYVRYVTTRFENLVDAFSVTSEQLAEAIRDYEVPRAKLHVIHTGVDAENEFSPERVAPIPGLTRGVAHILVPGRLVEQKDPLLMVDVASALAETGARFQIHAVGEGHLEPVVRSKLAERSLDGRVLLHGSTATPAPWFRAADIVLMTSEYEGVPYTLFEAMAMGVPAVVPAIPGNLEVLPENCGKLIDPRDDVSKYVDAL